MRADLVLSPSPGELSTETVSKVNDIRNLITQLSIDLNIEEYQLQREKELQTKLERIRHELAPLEEVRIEAAGVDERPTFFPPSI